MIRCEFCFRTTPADWFVGGDPCCCTHAAILVARGMVPTPVEASVRLPTLEGVGSAPAHQTGHHHRATLVGSQASGG